MAEDQDFERQKENILLPYTMEVVEILRKIEHYVWSRYMERKNSMDLKSLEPQQDIEIIIDIEKKKKNGKEPGEKEHNCFLELINKVSEHSHIKEISKKIDNALRLRIMILILGRILGYDGKELWGDIYKMVVSKGNPVIEQPFYRFKFYSNYKIGLVIKDYITIPKDFVAAYFGYDTGIDGLNQLMYGGFLLPPDRSAYISISGEAGIGKTALAVRLITAFFQNYNFKNVHYPYEEGTIKQINKNDARSLSIHYILMEQHEKNIIRLIKECLLIAENNKNVEPILKNKEKITEKDIRKIINFGTSDMFSPMGLIEKVETIENSRDEKDKGKRKVIVIDSVNAIQEMDINRTEWRELFQSIKAITRDGNTIVIFIVEKKSEEPDFVIEYLSDVVIKLHRDYKEDAFYRIFELVESRFQRSISGKHILYITKPNSGFIRIYPSTTAMGELLPHRKRVKPTESDDSGNRKEVGIKIDGIIHFFKYSHLFQTKMEPFFQKNSITMFIGDRGAHKSGFAKQFALSAFRDERWETPTNYIVEIDYREQEPNKPLEELLIIGFWNAKPVEKSISLLLYFSENYDEDPEKDIIWEIYFGKVIIPGCKGKGKNYIGHISHIVCLYEVKDYTEDVYIYQLDELIRAIESCEAKDDIPASYYDFINRKSISLVHRITKEDGTRGPINFNPFNIVYEGDFIKNLKIYLELIDRFIKQEIRIMNFQQDDKEFNESLVNIKKLFEPINDLLEDITNQEKIDKLINDPIKNYYAPSSKTDLGLLNKVNQEVNKHFKTALQKIKDIKENKIGDIDDKYRIIRTQALNLIDERIHRIDFIRRMLISQASYYNIKSKDVIDVVGNLKAFKDEKEKDLFNMELLDLDKIRDKDNKKFNEKAFDYKNIDKVKVSRIVLDDAENLDEVYKSLNPPKYISTLAHLCLAREITLGIVNTRSKDETSKVDTVCNAVSDNAFQFDKFFFKGEMFTTFSIIRSATSVHNNMRYYLSKRDDGLLQLNNTFALLSNVEKQNPEPIEIRLFLPDLSKEFSNSMYRILLNRDRILYGHEYIANQNKKEQNGNEMKDFGRRIDYASEFKVTDKKGLETIYNPRERFPSIYKEWHDFLKDMITYSLAHPKVDVFTANDPFTDISIILDDESAKDAISILCLPGYLMDLYEKNLASISDYVHFRGTEDHLSVWTKLKDEQKWIEIVKNNEEDEQNPKNDDKMNKKVKLGNEFYYLHEAAIRMPDGTQNNADERKHFWIIPEILFNPAIARDETTNKVIIKEYKKQQYMDIKGYPYYIDPRVNLVFSTEDSNGSEESEPDYFVHNDAHDFVALFFELWFNKANCEKTQTDRPCKATCNFCFFEQATETGNEEDIKSLVIDFVAHVKRSVLFNQQGLAKNINRLFNNGKPGETKIVLREWYSSAQQKLKVIEPLLMNLKKKIHVRLETPKYFLYTTWYLAIPVNSPRKDMASEIIIKMTEPHDLAHHQISGIGLQLDARFYGKKMNKFYPKYDYSKVLSAMKNLTKYNEKCPEENESTGIPIASNHCYFEHLTLLGGFLGDFYRYYKNSVSTEKGFCKEVKDSDNEDIDRLTKKLIQFSKNFKYWQREDKKRCDSCYMTYLLCQYKKKKDECSPETSAEKKEEGGK